MLFILLGESEFIIFDFIPKLAHVDSLLHPIVILYANILFYQFLMFYLAVTTLICLRDQLMNVCHHKFDSVTALATTLLRK